MKITVNQLRRVIKEEVSRAARRQRLNESKNLEARLLDIVGEGEVEDYEDLAEVIMGVKRDMGDVSKSEAETRIQSELEALADRFDLDLSVEKSNALTDQIMGAFFAGADWGHDEDDLPGNFAQVGDSVYSFNKVEVLESPNGGDAGWNLLPNMTAEVVEEEDGWLKIMAFNMYGDEEMYGWVESSDVEVER